MTEPCCVFRINVSLRQFVEYFWEGRYFSELNERMLGETECVLSPWNRKEESDLPEYTRTFSSVHPLPIQLPWLPLHVTNSTVQTIGMRVSGDLFIEIDATIRGVPGAEPTVLSRWEVSEVGEQTCECAIYLSFQYAYFSLIQSLVELNSRREMNLYHDMWLREAKQFIENHKHSKGLDSLRGLFPSIDAIVTTEGAHLQSAANDSIKNESDEIVRYSENQHPKEELESMAHFRGSSGTQCVINVVTTTQTITSSSISIQSVAVREQATQTVELLRDVRVGSHLGISPKALLNATAISTVKQSVGSGSLNFISDMLKHIDELTLQSLMYMGEGRVVLSHIASIVMALLAINCMSCRSSFVWIIRTCGTFFILASLIRAALTAIQHVPNRAGKLVQIFAKSEFAPPIRIEDVVKPTQADQFSTMQLSDSGILTDVTFEELTEQCAAGGNNKYQCTFVSVVDSKGSLVDSKGSLCPEVDVSDAATTLIKTPSQFHWDDSSDHSSDDDDSIVASFAVDNKSTRSVRFDAELGNSPSKVRPALSIEVTNQSTSMDTDNWLDLNGVFVNMFTPTASSSSDVRDNYSTASTGAFAVITDLFTPSSSSQNNKDSAKGFFKDDDAVATSPKSSKDVDSSLDSFAASTAEVWSGFTGLFTPRNGGTPVA